MAQRPETSLGFMSLKIVYHRRNRSADQLGWPGSNPFAAPSVAAIGGSFDPGRVTGNASANGGGGGAAIGGSVSLLLRQVVFEISGSFSGVLASTVFAPVGAYENYDAAGQIKRTLEQNGWVITNVVETGSSVLWAGRTFRITAQVHSDVTDTQVTNGAKNTLAGIISVSSVKLVASTPAEYITGTTGGGGSNSNAIKTSAGILGNFDLSTLAIGGLSGGVVVALGVVAIFALRR